MAKNKKLHIDKTGWLTTTRQRAKYYISDLSRTCEGAIITTFLTMFLLMQGIDLVKMSGVLLFVKIVDSFDDVIFGYLIDRFDPTRWKGLKKFAGEGKYLPWYRLTFWLFPVFTILFFMMPTNMSENLKLVWFAVFYLLYDFSYTLVEVPMNSIAITLTDNIDERNTIVQNRGILNTNVIMFIGIIFYALVSEQVGLPLKWVVVGSSVIFLICMLPMTHGVKEFNVDLKNVSAEEEEHYTLKDMFLCVKTNKYLLILVLSQLFITMLATGTNLVNFVSYYHFGNSLYFAIPMLVVAIPSLIAQMNTARITKKFGKRMTVLVCGIAGAIIYGLVFLAAGLPRMGKIIVVCICVGIQALPNNIATIGRTFLLPDTIEYTRYKTGKDCSGICYAINSFVTKLTQSFASSFALFLLGLSGWKEINATDFADIAAQNIKQPQSSLNMLWALYSIIPAIGMLLGAAVIYFYRLDDKDAELMAKCNAGEITKEECEAKLSKKY